MVPVYQHFEIFFSATGAAEESPEGQAATLLGVGVLNSLPRIKCIWKGEGKKNFTQ